MIILKYCKVSVNIIKTIYDVHKNAIEGFHILQNGLIGSFSFDYVINIWSLEYV